MEGIKAPGLKWRKLATGKSPIWVADEAAVKAGYLPKTVNLKQWADQPAILAAKCTALQAEMELWRVGYRHDRLAFDGTVNALIDIYANHPRSPYRKLKPGSRLPYDHYIKHLKAHIGPMRVDEITGVDILDWHEDWSSGGRFLAAAVTARAVFGAALSFGIMLRHRGCAELKSILDETRKKLPQPRKRTAMATADQVVAARRAAHAAGSPSRALLYAFTFETVLRLWDVMGQWWPMDEGGVSDVLDADRKLKWFGLKWEDIDSDLVLRYTPSKTDGSTEAEVIYSLALAPMVLEELQHWPAEKRKGPIIVSEETGQPWRASIFQQRWTVDRKAAGLSAKLWARDLRASGITEARANNAALEDASKVAGHASPRTTETYDRAVLQAADRFAEARLRGRERSGNGGGNGR